MHTISAIWTTTHLQCTTMGPALGGFENLTLRIKERSPVAWYGTPWSGQPVKWNCLTSRISLYPLCAHMLKKCFKKTKIKLLNTIMGTRPGWQWQKWRIYQGSYIFRKRMLAWPGLGAYLDCQTITKEKKIRSLAQFC